MDDNGTDTKDATLPYADEEDRTRQNPRFQNIPHRGSTLSIDGDDSEERSKRVIEQVEPEILRIRLVRAPSNAAGPIANTPQLLASASAPVIPTDPPMDYLDLQQPQAMKKNATTTTTDNDNANNISPPEYRVIEILPANIPIPVSDDVTDNNTTSTSRSTILNIDEKGQAVLIMNHDREIELIQEALFKTQKSNAGDRVSVQKSPGEENKHLSAGGKAAAAAATTTTTTNPVDLPQINTAAPNVATILPPTPSVANQVKEEGTRSNENDDMFPEDDMRVDSDSIDSEELLGKICGLFHRGYCWRCCCCCCIKGATSSQRRKRRQLPYRFRMKVLRLLLPYLMYLTLMIGFACLTAYYVITCNVPKQSCVLGNVYYWKWFLFATRE